MGISTVKSHVRHTKSGQTVRVKSYSKVSAEKLQKKEALQKQSKIKKMFYNVVKSTKLAKELADRYKDRPMNAKLMLNSTWGNIKVTSHRVDKDGNRKPYTTTKRMVEWSEKEWKAFRNENIRLIHSIINKKFAFKGEFREDLEQAGVRALYEAAGAYGQKYNPSEPADWVRHASSFITGTMQNELNRQMATHMSMPYQKQRLYGKFKDAWFKHHGDWGAIYKEMNLTKKDLYPNIDKEQANDPLPKEGYLTFKKDEAVKGQLEEYEKRVNVIQDRFNTSMDTLKMRRDGSVKEYKGALAQYDKQVTEFARKKMGANAKVTKEINQQIRALKNSKDLYSKTFKPITTDEDYNKEHKVLVSIQQAELKDAKETLDKKVDRSTLTGANELFRQFEALMDFKEVNLSDGVMSDAGDFKSYEEVAMPVDADTDLAQLGHIFLPVDFKASVERFLNDINQLDKRSATVMKMRLGLHNDNELYAHGLWGKPMAVAEIADAIDNRMYPKIERGIQKTHTQRMKSWNDKKPTSREYKDKVNKVVYDKALSSFKRKRKKAITEFKSVQKTDAYKKVKDKVKYRANFHKKRGTDMASKPSRFEVKTMTPKEFKRQERIWRASKPIEANTRQVLMKKISADVEMASATLRRIADPKNVQRMMSAYRSMRKYAIERPDIQGSLMKSLIFDHTLGITYVTPEKLDLIKAEQALEKANTPEKEGVVDKAKEYFGRWFGADGIFATAFKKED